MKNWKMLILVMLISACTALAARKVVDKVVAVVNNTPIIESELDRILNTIKFQARQKGQQLPDDKTLRFQILEQEIMEKIILQMGDKVGLKISEKNLDQAIQNIAAQNGMTMNQLRSRLIYNRINYDTYRSQIRKEMVIAAIRYNEVHRRITILPQEVETLAKQVTVQNPQSTQLNINHIFLPLPANTTHEQVKNQKKLAIQLISKLKNGADFDELAVADSQAWKGRNLGWAKIEALPILFKKALATAKKGDIVGPLFSGIGFHILQVHDLRGENPNIFVKEVYARHILLKSSSVINDNEARKKLEKIATDIKTGQTTFAIAAKEFSDEPSSANQGGNLGWILPEAFDPTFRDTLLNLKKKEISHPIHSYFGWHLIQVLDTRQVNKINAIKKERAYNLLFNRKFAEETQKWMQEQRESAYVRILDDNDK